MSGKNATTESDHRIPTGKEKRKGKEAGPVVVVAVVVAAVVLAAVVVAAVVTVAAMVTVAG